MATWAIGDVQGCFHSFKALLAKIDYDSKRDRLWLVGDMVNRGTGSLRMLRWVHKRQERVTAVLGNHELGLLACAAGARKPRDTDTITPILRAEDRAELLTFVQELPLLHVESGHVLVHAGLHPHWDLGTCERQARRRTHAALDVFTRMRVLRPNMTLDLRFSGPPEAALPGHKPWFELRVFEPDHTVIFGHWAALGARRGDRWQSLDTGCVWGGRLTAMRLSDGALVSVKADRRDLVGAGPVKK